MNNKKIKHLIKETIKRLLLEELGYSITRKPTEEGKIVPDINNLMKRVKELHNVEIEPIDRTEAKTIVELYGSFLGLTLEDLEETYPYVSLIRKFNQAYDAATRITSGPEISDDGSVEPDSVRKFLLSIQTFFEKISELEKIKNENFSKGSDAFARDLINKIDAAVKANKSLKEEVTAEYLKNVDLEILEKGLRNYRYIMAIIQKHFSQIEELIDARKNIFRGINTDDIQSIFGTMVKKMKKQIKLKTLPPNA